MTGEKLVGFGASFDGSGLVSTGTVRELIEGTEQEHVEEDVFALGGVTGGGQGFAPGSQSVYGAFEALALDRGARSRELSSMRRRIKSVTRRSFFPRR